jgi:hypothetical protein
MVSDSLTLDSVKFPCLITIPYIHYFSSQIGWKHLKDDIGRMGADSGFTALVWPLGVEDPDDAFSSVPYEKVTTSQSIEKHFTTECIQTF